MIFTQLSQSIILQIKFFKTNIFELNTNLPESPTGFTIPFEISIFNQMLHAKHYGVVSFCSRGKKNCTFAHKTHQNHPYLIFVSLKKIIEPRGAVGSENIRYTKLQGKGGGRELQGKSVRTNEHTTP